MNDTHTLTNRSSTPLARYRLARAALDLRTFTVSELVALTRVPENTVYSFLYDLGLQRVTSEALTSGTPGRPRKLYTLTGEGVEHLVAQNLELAAVLRTEGFGTLAPREEAAPPTLPQVAIAEPAQVASPAPEPVPRRRGMSLDSLHGLYVGELKDLYSAEKQILQALPRMAKKAANPLLRQTFEEHLEVTRKQVERLDEIFERLERSPRGKKCKGMEGLIEESKEIMQEDLEPEVMDAVLISAAHKIEHYEIAGYGTVCTYARLLGEEEDARLIQQTLDEEGQADEKLTRLAESAASVEVGIDYYSSAS
jgi:ferritin-like metal-binding protein YciE